MPIHLSDQKDRMNIVREITSEENISRKREHQRRFDVFRERQDRYILERLEREFSTQTLNNMRKVLSINLVPRIIKEMSSIYTNEPVRNFTSTSGRDLSENELAQLENLYDILRIDNHMQKANEFFNLHKQCALMIVPDMRGKFKVRVLPPMHYDVIPDENDVEQAFAYVLSVWNLDLHKSTQGTDNERTQRSDYQFNNQVNEKIADENDRQALLDRYIVWTAEDHFVMNGRGDILEDFGNPINRLPFIDIADDKDFQFFVRRGANEVDFALDLSLILSDLANIIRLQGYSQAVMASEKQPQDLNIGPQKVLWLPINPNSPGPDPKFEFVTPNPDLDGSIKYAESILNIFLSSRGIDPSTVSGKGEARSFSSGMERLLAMLDKFEATKADFTLFQWVESQVFEVMRLWSNEFQDVTGEGEIVGDLRLSSIGDDVFLDVKFSEPSTVQTKSEKEESVLKLLDAGLMSRVEAIQELRDVEAETAEKVLEEIDRDGTLERVTAPVAQGESEE